MLFKTWYVTLAVLACLLGVLLESTLLYLAVRRERMKKR